MPIGRFMNLARAWFGRVWQQLEYSSVLILGGDTTQPTGQDDRPRLGQTRRFYNPPLPEVAGCDGGGPS